MVWEFVDELASMFAEQRTAEWALAVGRPRESQDRLERALDDYDDDLG